MDFKKELDFLGDILEIDIDKFSLETHLDELENWDSVNILSFMALSDEKYGVTVTAEDLEKTIYVKDILTLLKKSDAI